MADLGRYSLGARLRHLLTGQPNAWRNTSWWRKLLLRREFTRAARRLVVMAPTADNPTYVEPVKPVTCPQCGEHRIEAELNANVLFCKVVAIDRGAAYILVDFDAQEFDVDVACMDCGFRFEDVHDYEVAGFPESPDGGPTLTTTADQS